MRRRASDLTSDLPRVDGLDSFLQRARLDPVQPESWERVERWLGAAKPSVSSIVTSRGGWDNIYERGQELIRRDDEGLLKPVGSERTA